MIGIPTWFRAVLTACVGFVLLQGGPAWAASFEVNPVRVSLSATTSSNLITVRNINTEPLRFQATPFAWTQGPAGDMQLAPTDEIVVFPTLFTIKPGESRNIRIGTGAPGFSVEKTYRVFVDELPPLAAQLTSNAIRVLTRMGIPVFVSPPAAKPAPRIDGLAVQRGQFAFKLRNLGTAFFMARHVLVSALAFDGTVILKRELPAWYVLAGGLRDYTDLVPAGACTAARLQVDVETETTTIRSSVELPQNACSR